MESFEASLAKKKMFLERSNKNHPEETDKVLKVMLKKIEGIEKKQEQQHQQQQQQYELLQQQHNLLQQQHQLLQQQYNQLQQQHQELQQQHDKSQQQHQQQQQVPEEEEQLVPFSFTRYINDLPTIPTFDSHEQSPPSQQLFSFPPASSLSVSANSTFNSSLLTPTHLISEISKYGLNLVKNYFSKTELSTATLTCKRSHGMLDPNVIKRIKENSMRTLGVTEKKLGRQFKRIGTKTQGV